VNTDVKSLELRPEERARLPLGFHAIFWKPTYSTAENALLQHRSERYASRSIMTAGSPRSLSRIY
jgi:hypothetical protein